MAIASAHILAARKHHRGQKNLPTHESIPVTKQVRKYGEGGKVAIRNIRRDAMDALKSMETHESIPVIACLAGSHSGSQISWYSF